MEILKEFHYHSIYELADLIDKSVKAGVGFWNYNVNFFIEASSKFSKDTLLHQYIAVTANNYHYQDFRKNPEGYETEEDFEKWYELFEAYSIEYKEYDTKKALPPDQWFLENAESFDLLFENMSEEVFYILFANRNFLLKFNSIVAETVAETDYPPALITKKRTLKRVPIPTWVKKAVYHREKGRCVFCNSDLTGLVNIFNSSNYDHIIPLDLFGANDPCNIQLSCERCNKTKGKKGGITSNLYTPWWSK